MSSPQRIKRPIGDTHDYERGSEPAQLRRRTQRAERGAGCSLMTKSFLVLIIIVFLVILVLVWDMLDINSALGAAMGISLTQATDDFDLRYASKAEVDDLSSRLSSLETRFVGVELNVRREERQKEATHDVPSTRTLIDRISALEQKIESLGSSGASLFSGDTKQGETALIAKVARLQAAIDALATSQAAVGNADPTGKQAPSDALVVPKTRAVAGYAAQAQSQLSLLNEQGTEDRSTVLYPGKGRYAHVDAVDHEKPYYLLPKNAEDPRAGIDMCSECLWQNVERSVKPSADGRMVFVQTGDISEMWIRDSSAQMHPYAMMAAHNDSLRHIVDGVLRQQAFFIRNNSYANSFRPEIRTNVSPQERYLNRTGWIGTYNYEMDSGCYYLRLLYYFYRSVGAYNGSAILEKATQEAVWATLRTFRIEQHHERLSPYRYLELPRGGLGTPTRYTGMSWSGHRASDEPTIYGYNIADNLFGVAVLDYVAIMAEEVWHDEHMAMEARSLLEEIKVGVHAHGIRNLKGFGDVYCFEVDGLGNCTLTDDANVPSLLSIPYLDPLGIGFDQRIYENTRRFILSAANPTFFAGKYASGIGSSHTPRGNVWHMAIVMQGLTTTSEAERLWALHTVQQTTAGRSQLHESFDVNDPKSFTRSWFGWPNALFAELWHSIYGTWCGIEESGTRWLTDSANLRPIASYAHLHTTADSDSDGNPVWLKR